jgi:hypothetical protein
MYCIGTSLRSSRLTLFKKLLNWRTSNMLTAILDLDIHVVM